MRAESAASWYTVRAAGSEGLVERPRLMKQGYTQVIMGLDLVRRQAQGRAILPFRGREVSHLVQGHAQFDVGGGVVRVVFQEARHRAAASSRRPACCNSSAGGTGPLCPRPPEHTRRNTGRATPRPSAPVSHGRHSPPRPRRPRGAGRAPPVRAAPFCGRMGCRCSARYTTAPRGRRGRRRPGPCRIGRTLRRMALQEAAIQNLRLLDPTDGQQLFAQARAAPFRAYASSRRHCSAARRKRSSPASRSARQQVARRR